MPESIQSSDFKVDLAKATYNGKTLEEHLRENEKEKIKMGFGDFHLEVESRSLFSITLAFVAGAIAGAYGYHQYQNYTNS